MTRRRGWWTRLLTVLCGLVLVPLTAVAGHAVVPGAPHAPGVLSLGLSARALRVGESLTVDVRLDTAERAASFVGVGIGYPADLLRYDSSDQTGSAFPSDAYVNAGPGFVYAAQSAGTDAASTVSGSSLRIIRLHFTALRQGTAALRPSTYLIVPIDDQEVQWPTRDRTSTVTVGAPSPFVLLTMTPRLMGTEGSHRVVLTGRGFTAATTVAISDTGVRITGLTRLSATTLTGTIHTDDVLPDFQGSRDVSVTSGGRTSTCRQCFAVVQGPYVWDVTPSEVPRASVTTVVVEGYFVDGIGYRVRGDRDVRVLGATWHGGGVSPQLWVRLSVRDGATPGPHPLTVTNLSTYGTATCRTCLRVT